MERTFLILAGILGLVAVGLGAFGAHGLERHLAGLDDAAKRLDWWRTAAHYHLVHAPALAVVAWMAHRIGGVAPVVAGFAFLIGVLLFSGSLYIMTLTDARLGMVTPLGGLSLMVGWAAIAWSALRWQLP